ncbi:MAG: hypothetical protein NVS1B4_20470 [Gemmatimonadaceae bacterium]
MVGRVIVEAGAMISAEGSETGKLRIGSILLDVSSSTARTTIADAVALTRVSWGGAYVSGELHAMTALAPTTAPTRIHVRAFISTTPMRGVRLYRMLSTASNSAPPAARLT